jgi:hypothetical protein
MSMKFDNFRFNRLSVHFVDLLLFLTDLFCLLCPMNVDEIRQFFVLIDFLFILSTFYYF